MSERNCKQVSSLAKIEASFNGVNSQTLLYTFTGFKLLLNLLNCGKCQIS